MNCSVFRGADCTARPRATATACASPAGLYQLSAVPDGQWGSGGQRDSASLGSHAHHSPSPQPRSVQAQGQAQFRTGSCRDHKRRRGNSHSVDVLSTAGGWRRTWRTARGAPRRRCSAQAAQGPAGPSPASPLPPRRSPSRPPQCAQSVPALGGRAPGGGAPADATPGLHDVPSDQCAELLY